MTAPTEGETLLRKCSGFQPSSATFLIACAANFGVAMLTKTSAPSRLQLDDVRVDRRIGDFVGVFGDDHRRCLVAEAVLQAVEIVLPEIVVLVEHGDLGVRLVLQDVLGVDRASVW